MKNILLLTFSALVFMTSCQKEEAPLATTHPTETPAVRMVQVDYTIYAASGDVEVIAIIEDNGTLIEKSFQVTKMNHTISFTTKSQQVLSVKARNTNPSHDEVMVSIFVDGLLFRSNSTTGTNTWAFASGSPL